MVGAVLRSWMLGLHHPFGERIGRQTEDHGPARHFDRRRHALKLRWKIDLVVAGVVLHIVDAPARVGRRVFLFVAIRTVSHVASRNARVEPEQEIFPVHVVSKALDAARKPNGIGDGGSVGGASSLPTVVDVHVLVTGRAKGRHRHPVGSVFHDRLGHFTSKVVPAVPPHGWDRTRSDEGAAEQSSSSSASTASLRASTIGSPFASPGPSKFASPEPTEASSSASGKIAVSVELPHPAAATMAAMTLSQGGALGAVLIRVILLITANPCAQSEFHVLLAVRRR